MEDFDSFEQLQENIDSALAAHREYFQNLLNQIAGMRGQTVVENQMLAAQIQEVAHRLQVAFHCPTCEQPARLKCITTGNSPTGVFAFAHTRTTHRGTVRLPELKLVPKGKDKRRKH